MRMPGGPDPLYVAARRVLLDALQAVRSHLDAFVLVGAQAVYMHTNEADLAVAPYTIDSDLAIDPARLSPEPLLEAVLANAGFAQTPDVVGIWHRSIHVLGGEQRVAVDLLVPESLGGSGRRGARIPPHGRQVARKVEGLEAALVDKDSKEIAALDLIDMRRFQIAVAGPAGLLVAKVYKIRDRLSERDRLSDKDALDVYRLLQSIPTKELVQRFRTLQGNDLSRQSTGFAVEQLPTLFGSPRAPGCVMAVRAAGPLADGEVLAASLVVLTGDLLEGL
ncbi:MAG TPA: hypothetical protein VEY33_04045 [Gemmatimonadota bacterium]|nr:hypothetical protein [Gemmatimonadota bacterium]